MSIKTTIDYNNASNFNFDSDVIEVGTNAKLKNRVNPNEIFFASFSSNLTVDRTEGDPDNVATLGNPTIQSGKLDLKVDDKYVRYDLTGIDFTPNAGTIQFDVTPNYSGNTGSYMHFFALAEEYNASGDMITLIHESNGNLALWLTNSGGGNIFYHNFGNWSPTQSQEYNFAICFNLLVPGQYETRLFIDGVQFGTTRTTGASRGPNTNSLVIGFHNIATSTRYFNGEIRNFSLYNNVQYTSDFSPEAPPLTPYVPGEHCIETISITGMDDLEGLVVDKSEPANTEVRFILTVDGINYYFTGGGLVVSDGTFAQANTLLEIQQNLTVEDFSNGVALQVKALLSTTDGLNTPELNSIEIAYNFYKPIDASKTTVVYGYILDAQKQPKTNAVIKVKGQVYFLDGNLINPNESITVDPNGYFELDIIESQTKDVDMTFEIFPEGDSGENPEKFRFDAQIPNSVDSISLEDLVGN